MVCRYKIAGKEVYKYCMPVIESNMFILISDKRALVVDPNENEDAVRLLKEKDVKDITILLTHEHFDHVSGVNFFREKWPCVVYGNQRCKEMVPDPTMNMAAFFLAMFISREEEERNKAQELSREDYSCKVDIGFEEALDIQWEELSLHLLETPGHSQGSICIVVNNSAVFTGDSLVQGAKVITRLPGGSKKAYQTVTRPFLEGLPQDMLVFPGHGEEGFIKDFQIG